CSRRRTRNETRQGLYQFIETTIGLASARQAAFAQAQVRSATRRTAGTRQTPTSVDSHRAMSGHGAVRPDRLPPLWSSLDWRRSATAPASVWETPGDQADRYRIPTASPGLFLRLLHLWRTAQGRAGRGSRTSSHCFRGPSQGLLSSVEAPRRPVYGHDSQPTRQR